MELIDKSALVTEIEKKLQDFIGCKKDAFYAEERVTLRAKINMCKEILSFINNFETKEVDFNTLGILAEHLLACEAHAVSPKYNERELDLLEEMSSNKVQEGE